MTHRLLTALLVLCMTVAALSSAEAEDFTKYVDPYIGSGGHGHVFLGANVPFGAVQLGPNNYHQGWDWCSGYHYSDDVVVGFAHTHLSGTGIPDMGDVMIMPYTGDVQLTPGTKKDKKAGYASSYSHDREEVRPGYYSVDLLDYDIKVELTATERVGVSRITYPEGKQARLALDMDYVSGGGGPVETTLRRVDNQTILGYRKSNGWAKDQRVYFAMKSTKPFAEFQVYHGKTLKELEGAEITKKTLRAVASFEGSPGEVILRVGISPVSMENALANLEVEAPSTDFDAVAARAKAKWNEQLSGVRIKTSSDRDRRIFYTALYHTMIAPVMFNDQSRAYRGTDKQVYRDPGFDNYSIFSLWDTYRAAHPLYTLTQPKRVGDFIQSMLAIYDQQGKLPVWHLMGNETDTMVGYHAVPVVVDAYFKGLLNADPERAYEAVKASAMRDERGLKFVKEIGYIPSEKEVESVAKAMEYAIDDWCIAKMAKALGKDDDHEYFMGRARAYKEYFDPETRFMRGKLADGSWREPFDPYASSHRRDDYCEGNGWQYLWLVPQDPEGLIDLLGGDEPFIEKLDQLFTLESFKTKGASSDISGLIGQYAHGNEPGHHTTYLFAYAGAQWKTAKIVRQILTTLYTDQPDGLSGNEDCGQMSAWYLLSSMGMYPVNPSAGLYVLGSPLFDEVELDLPGGKTFRIVAQNNSPENRYIQSVKLNGQAYESSYVLHRDIVAGGELEVVMGPEPNKQFGLKPEHRPASQVFPTDPTIPTAARPQPPMQ